MIEIKNVVVLGANGTMGAGSGEVFAGGGCDVVFLARAVEKAHEGLVTAQNMAKSQRIADRISVGTYSQDLEDAVGKADVIFEALAEDIDLKKTFFAKVDKCRRPDSIVATVSSGLSIAEMAHGRSESFRRNFLGIHLFNPPHVIVGTEVIPHAGTDRKLVPEVVRLLETRFGRVAIVTDDKPAFCGNRIGFKVLNEVAQLAEEHGVAFMDQLVGSHTGRALPPLATIDLVGWDVHKAIVDNLYANTHDIAHKQFRLPAYMQRGIDRGHLGRKTRDKGGFFRLEGRGASARQLVLDPATGDYRPLAEIAPAPPAFVESMKAQIRSGRDQGYRGAMEILCTAEGKEAELLRRVVLGYVSYGLGLVGDVVARPRDIDRIMGFGFLWAPPSILVDAIGPGRTIVLLERARLPVPPAIISAAVHQRALFNEPHVDNSRFFVAAA